MGRLRERRSSSSSPAAEGEEQEEAVPEPAPARSQRLGGLMEAGAEGEAAGAVAGLALIGWRDWRLCSMIARQLQQQYHR